MKTTNLIARLNEMTPKHTSVICDVVVTRWTGGWEFDTVGRKLDAVSAEDAARLLRERSGEVV